MIVVTLQGGLGNQMFQYACGKALALRHEQPLYMDASFLQQNQHTTDEFTPRNYELDAFDLKTPFVSDGVLDRFKKDSIIKKIKKGLHLPYPKCYTENQAANAGQLDNITFPILLNGYWQSEQYFAAYRQVIRKLFAFGNIPESLNELMVEIGRTNAVSVHYRRGDYLTNPVAVKVLGPLADDYYQSAIQKISELFKDPFFYIFSDDPAWVKDNFCLTENYRVVHETAGGKAWYDMLLMSRCKHHIIANSSYSWWGAWLNEQAGKVVVAPKRWFAQEDFNENTSNIIPGDWHRV
jgi:hypothetical protein